MHICAIHYVIFIGLYEGFLGCIYCIYLYTVLSSVFTVEYILVFTMRVYMYIVVILYTYYESVQQRRFSLTTLNLKQKEIYFTFHYNQK